MFSEFKAGLHSSVSYFGPDIVDIVLDNVCKRLYLGVGQLREVCGDVVVEVDFDVRIF